MKLMGHVNQKHFGVLVQQVHLLKFFSVIVQITYNPKFNICCIYVVIIMSKIQYLNLITSDIPYSLCHLFCPEQFY